MRKLLKKLLVYFPLFQKKGYGLAYTDSMPPTEKVPDKTLVIVGSEGFFKWAVMKCPCGCGDLLTLSLMKSHKPNWRYSVDKENKATLTPSIWKKDGCRSHFFLRKGQIVWANDEND